MRTSAAYDGRGLRSPLHGRICPPACTDRLYLALSVVVSVAPLIGGGGAEGAMAERRCVLVVDDDDSIREIAQVTLEAVRGWRVRTASSGLEAIECALRKKPDAVLLDALVPGLDGRSAVAHLRAERLPGTSPCPVVCHGPARGRGRSRPAPRRGRGNRQAVRPDAPPGSGGQAARAGQSRRAAGGPEPTGGLRDGRWAPAMTDDRAVQEALAAA